MKFFSSENGFCFGCSVNTSKTEIISADASVPRRRTNQRKSTKQWRPALNVISEDSVRSRRPESTTVVRSEKKSSNKDKSAGRTRSDSFDIDYRKSSHQVALPVFSPTPFLF